VAGGGSPPPPVGPSTPGLFGVSIESQQMNCRPVIDVSALDALTHDSDKTCIVRG